MTIVVIDYELEGFECTDFLDGRNMETLSRKKFKKWLSAQNEDIYFVDVNDKTWERYKTKRSKKIELDLDGLIELIDKSTWLILIKKNHVRACMWSNKHIF